MKTSSGLEGKQGHARKLLRTYLLQLVNPNHGYVNNGSEARIDAILAQADALKDPPMDYPTPATVKLIEDALVHALYALDSQRSDRSEPAK